VPGSEPAGITEEVTAVLENILEMSGISKSYPNVQALDQVHFELRKGEVHALLGENGAGKSTLIKILSGSEKRDSGTIVFDGRPIEHYSPSQAIDMGISVIYQEFNLVPQMTVEQNLFLGREKRNGIFVNKRAMSQTAEKIIRSFGIYIAPNALIQNLSVAHQQIVEIAKAILNDAKLFVMDEPSAALSNKELEMLFKIIDELKKQGKSIIYISHRLEEIFRIADRVTILRDGKYICTNRITEMKKEDLIRNMVGREITAIYPRKEFVSEECVLAVSNLNNSKVRNISFKLNKGEILGISGLMGAGRTETVRSIFGLDKCSVEIYRNGKLINIKDPIDAIENGIGLIPEDRKTQGLLMKMSVAHNISFSSLRRISRYKFVNTRKEKELVRNYISRLRIRTPSENQLVKHLSGGNQQKVVLTKWLATECDILIFDEPTRGIDVGAKSEIYSIMHDMVNQGKSIIMISSELPELMGMCNRIMVMYNGYIAATLSAGDFDQEIILEYASGER